MTPGRELAARRFPHSWLAAPLYQSDSIQLRTILRTAATTTQPPLDILSNTTVLTADPRKWRIVIDFTAFIP